jgi:hypothetical protein
MEWAVLCSFSSFATGANLAGTRSPPPSPLEPSKGRARICFRFPVSLLSLLGGGAGRVDRVVLSWLFVFSSFFGVSERSAHPFWGEKGVPAKCIIPKSLPSFPLVSVNYIPRKYQPIPYQNTNSGYSSRLMGFTFFPSCVITLR